MNDLKTKISVIAVTLAVIFIFGATAVYASPNISPVSPPAPDGWTWDDDEPDLSLQQRRHVMRLVVGQYIYTQNGMPQTSDAAPFVSEGRTMVPLRLVAEAMGAEVDWNVRTNTITVTHSATVVTLVVNRPLPGSLGTPIIVGGRTFVPLRFVAENLGADVNWDGQAQSIEVIWSFEPPAGTFELIR